MSMRIRRAGVIAAILICGLTPAGVLAQSDLPVAPPPGQVYENPTLRSKPPTELGGGSATPAPTPTPTPTPEPAATATATPEPTASPQPTATSAPSSSDLPRTGTNPLRVALAGMALLGFGLSLRVRHAGRSR